MNESTPNYAKSDAHTWARFWDAGAHWPLLFGAVTLSVCAIAAELLWPTFDSLPPLFLGSIVLVPTLILWLVRWVRRKQSGSLRWFWRPMPLAVLMGVNMLAGFILAESNACLRLSRPAMDRLAREVLTAPPGSSMPGKQRCGLIEAWDIKRIDGGVAFESDYGGVFDWCGYAYHPGGLPAGLLNRATPEGYTFDKNIGGDWYEVSRN